MLKKISILTFALALALSFALSSSTALAKKRRFVSIAAGWVTGAYFPMAGAISRVAFNNLQDKNIKVTAESSGASVANANLIATENTDFAILQNDIASYAYNGKKGIFDEPVSNIRGVACLYPEHIQVVVRKDAGIESVADLKGKRVAVGPIGSGTTENCKQILSAWGLSLDDLGEAQQLTASQSADYLKDGRLDAAFFTVAVGAAVIKDTATIIDAAILPISGPRVDKLIEKYPFYAKQKVAGGSYKGNPDDVPTVSVMAMLSVRENLDDDLVYSIVKAMYSNLDQIHKAHAKFKDLSVEGALDGMSIPLHPAAERFLKEEGVL
ncbi:MAG: TAXI family TRAP transporter solute-binding subunit [Desulfohalobiaceae bacterium]|nr:TAXI family TRAP transporter solute-binding subunit [Desulfohalobiaceae bacterium]